MKPDAPAKHTAPTKSGELANETASDTTPRSVAMANVPPERALEAVAAISHDLRNHLNGVLGLSSSLLGSVLQPDQRDQVEQLYKSGNAMLEIVNNVLTAFQLERGRTPGILRAFSVRRLLDSVMQVLSARAMDSNTELFAYLASDMSPWLMGDPSALRQILVNLADNAIKFAAGGEVVVQASVVGQTPHNTKVKFTVMDDGIGIAPDALERIFLPFEQADTSITARYGGTGLGLMISTQLANQLGGVLDVQSTPGRGTTFSLTLDLRRVEVDTPSNASPPPFQNAQVFVVTARKHLLSCVADAVSDWGWSSTASTSFAEAAQQCQSIVAAGGVAVVAVDADTVNLEAEFSAAAKTNLTILTRRSDSLPMMLRRSRAGLSIVTKPFGRDKFLTAILEALGAADAASQRSLRSTPRLLSRLIGAQILVVDDNPINQMVAIGQLRSMGALAHGVANGREAIGMLQERSYAAVLMDLSMPVMDGFEATRHIRRMPAPASNTPVLALTASGDWRSRQKCIEARMNGFLVKPVTPFELAEALSQHVVQSATAAAASSPAAATSDARPAPARPMGRVQVAKRGGDGNGRADIRVARKRGQRLDISVLNRIRGTGLRGHSVLGQLVQMFRNSASDRIKAATRALERERFEDAAKILHSLKGSALTLGANRLGHRVIKTERATARKNREQALERIQLAQEELQATLKALDEYCAEQ